MANSKNIWAATLAADGGSFYRAVLGTALPEDALEALPAAYKDHGWMGDDGFKIAQNRDTTKHKAFGGSVVKVTQDNYEVTVTATIYEQNAVTLATVFGDANVTRTMTADTTPHATYRVDWSEQMMPRSIFVQRYIDGNKTGLNVIPEGQVTAVDEIEYVHNRLVRFTITIDCFKTEDEPALFTLLDDPDDITP